MIGPPTVAELIHTRGSARPPALLAKKSLAFNCRCAGIRTGWRDRYWCRSWRSCSSRRRGAPKLGDIPLVCTLNSSVESTVRNVMDESTILSLAIPSTRKPFVKGCPPPMLTAAGANSTAPGRRSIRFLDCGNQVREAHRLRPFSGNSITLRSSITVPSDDVLGSAAESLR